MTRRLASFLLIALCCVPPVMGQQSPAADAEQAARDFLYALYTNDAAEVQRRILPGDDASLLIGRQTFTQAHQDRLSHAISRRRYRRTAATYVRRLEGRRAVLACDAEAA